LQLPGGLLEGPLGPERDRLGRADRDVVALDPQAGVERRLLGVERDREDLLLALALDGDLDGLPELGLGQLDDLLAGLGAADRLAVDREDLVADLEPGRGRRAADAEARELGPDRLLDADRCEHG